MSQNEIMRILQGYEHLIIEASDESSSVSIRLPWWPKKRVKAIEERSLLIAKVRSIWHSTVLINDREGHIEHVALSLGASLAAVKDRLSFGNWIWVFGKVDQLVLDEILIEGALAMMSAEDVLRSTKASCIIVSEPDDIEWTILFASE
jgi:hypothetical protein